jgi:hypothetical protein
MKIAQDLKNSTGKIRRDMVVNIVYIC